MRTCWWMLLLAGCATEATGPAWASVGLALSGDVMADATATDGQGDAVALATCVTDSTCAANGDPCLKFSCVDGECRSMKDPGKVGCCSLWTNTSCDDKSFCSDDFCDVPMPGGWLACSHKMKAVLKGSCCTADNAWWACNDGEPCTKDSCDSNGSGSCTHIWQPNCCAMSMECDDNDANTVDACQKFPTTAEAGTCVHEKIGCDSAGDCDDGKACTFDVCMIETGQCYPIQLDLACCEDDSTCTAGNSNTVAACIDHQCVSALKPGTCLTNQQCPSADDCHPGVCVAGKCAIASTKTAGCCLDDKDALTTCDDGSGCTIDYCSNNFCRHTAPKNGCCATSKDCNDGDLGTTDKCSNVDPGTDSGTCTYVLSGNVCCTKSGTFNGAECYDGNGCTLDSCEYEPCACHHLAIAGCCIDKFDCDDGKAATTDLCVQSECLSF